MNTLKDNVHSVFISRRVVFNFDLTSLERCQSASTELVVGLKQICWNEDLHENYGTR